MEKKITIFFLLSFGVCAGQNLIPNGNFETNTSCPYVGNSFSTLSNWFNPSINSGWGSTPDYFNGCSNLQNDVDVPSNFAGYQFARSGIGYAGIILWSSQLTFREYISVQLLSPLTTGYVYHFEMYLNLANSSKYSCSNIGIYFSDTIITSTINYDPLPYNPQISNINSNYPDTLNWTLISGNYTALGGETYVVIGNFKNDSNTYPVLIDSNAVFTEAYMFIDDISLTLITGITEQNNEKTIQVFPTLFHEKLYFSNNFNQSCNVIIYDETVRKVVEFKYTEKICLKTGCLNKGVYIYQVLNNGKLIATGKLIKQ